MFITLLVAYIRRKWAFLIDFHVLNSLVHLNISLLSHLEQLAFLEHQNSVVVPVILLLALQTWRLRPAVDRRYTFAVGFSELLLCSADFSFELFAFSLMVGSIVRQIALQNFLNRLII
jgi:hypothetical protein